MSNRFSWKGLKIGLVGVAIGFIALCITTDNRAINYMANILMLIGVALGFAGVIIHNREMFKKR